MNYEELDILFRSRQTLLKILKENGYNTSAYDNFGPWEIEAMVSAGQQALTMNVKREATEDNPITTCRVVYSLQKLKQKLNSFLENLTNSEQENPVLPETTEVIVILLEDVADVFHAAALSEWAKKKLRIRFFKAHNLIFDPREHILVPKHERIPPAEHAQLMKGLYITKKANFPIIKFHEDMIARIMGLIPDDIVKITRPSPSAGTYEIYRVCKA